jgi:hypothetical protein
LAGRLSCGEAEKTTMNYEKWMEHKKKEVPNRNISPGLEITFPTFPIMAGLQINI